MSLKSLLTNWKFILIIAITLVSLGMLEALGILDLLTAYGLFILIPITVIFLVMLVINLLTKKMRKPSNLLFSLGVGTFLGSLVLLYLLIIASKPDAYYLIPVLLILPFLVLISILLIFIGATRGTTSKPKKIVYLLIVIIVLGILFRAIIKGPFAFLGDLFLWIERTFDIVL